MREYIIMAAVGAVIASVADIIAPDGWKNYVRIAAGFLILALLISPVAKLKDTKPFLSPQQEEVTADSLKKNVLEELHGNVEKDIEERLFSEFGIEAEATVKIDADEEYNITGVREIRIKTRKIPDGLEERLRYVYGCERIEFE